MSVTASDKACTVGQARLSLVAADRVGLEGWSRLNAGLTREQSWSILLNSVTADDRDASEILDSSGLIGSHIRRGFGTDGKKRGLKEPRQYRRRTAETW